jgi:tRNA U34 5-methylaminomethyl-2-thiouridine-forming methyltransferase MnmC
MEDNVRIIETNDGSKSLYLPELDETYHSRHGALQESQHVYLKSGLEYLVEKGASDSIRIFELGFGTGLNTYLTANYASQEDIPIYYRSIEKFPLNPKIIEALKYSDLIESKNDLFEKIIRAPWDAIQEISPHFKLEKIHGDFFEYVDEGDSFDLMYFDAFGFRAQSELWEKRAFEICASLLRVGGVLVTYAAKGVARRNLQSCGFDVERIPGAPGKREMMRATKTT